MERFFTSNSEKNFENIPEFSLNYNPNETDMHKTKENLLLSRLDNRLKMLKENIKIFLKINLNTSLFKKDVIKFFLFLKMKQKNLKSEGIDNKLDIEKNSIIQLKHSAIEILNVEKKIEGK